MNALNKKKIETYPKKFGDYLLLKPLSKGGMAEVFLARSLKCGNIDDTQNINKVLCIKTIKPEKEDTAHVKNMFLDEIKTVYGLNHPNIVNTFDYGEADNKLYITMEYIDGADIREFIRALKKNKKRFSIGPCLHIAKTISDALHYTHNYRDQFTGIPFKLVHRDISPDNIMITFDGSLKLIDFGVAKSDVKSQKTQDNIVKGKASYIAPEYIHGSQIDHKSDQYSLGITLWELLTNKVCFTGENNLVIIKKVLVEEILPPSTYNKSISKELDNIVMKAVHKDPNQRYKNMEDFSISLTKYLNNTFPDFHPSILKKYAHALFSHKISETNLDFKTYAKLDLSDYLDDSILDSTNTYTKLNLVNDDNSVKSEIFKISLEIDKSTIIEDTSKRHVPDPSEDYIDNKLSFCNNEETYLSVESEQDVQTRDRKAPNRKWRQKIKDELQKEEDEVLVTHPLFNSKKLFLILFFIFLTIGLFYKDKLLNLTVRSDTKTMKPSFQRAQEVEREHKKRVEKKQKEKRKKLIDKLEF